MKTFFSAAHNCGARRIRNYAKAVAFCKTPKTEPGREGKKWFKIRLNELKVEKKSFSCNKAKSRITRAGMKVFFFHRCSFLIYSPLRRFPCFANLRRNSLLYPTRRLFCVFPFLLGLTLSSPPLLGFVIWKTSSQFIQFHFMFYLFFFFGVFIDLCVDVAGRYLFRCSNENGISCAKVGKGKEANIFADEHRKETYNMARAETFRTSTVRPPSSRLQPRLMVVFW